MVPSKGSVEASMGRKKKLRQQSIAWNDAWNRRDPEGLTAFLAEGSTYYEPELSGPVPGGQGLRAAAETTWADWPGATFEIVTLTVQGERTIVEWRSSATHRTGAALQLEGVDVLEWDGDRIGAVRVYYDVHQRRSAIASD